MTGPYAMAAGDYLNVGFSPLPLPYKEKSPPPNGFTGASGRRVTATLVERWSAAGKRNIGLRIPDTVIGLDVDAYVKGDVAKAGAETLAELESRWGALPDTWRSTARPDGVSGIRVFRIPSGLAWPGQAGPAVELIRWDHRYMVAAPSIHDKTGKPYRWYDPAGKPISVRKFVKSGVDFAELPAAWVDGLTSGRQPFQHHPKAEMSRDETRAELSACFGADGEPCEVMRGWVERHVAALGASRAGGAHDAACTASYAAVQAGREGHAGVLSALSALREAFFAATATRRRDAAEWGRMVDGAVKRSKGNQPERAAEDFCDLFLSFEEQLRRVGASPKVARRLAEAHRRRTEEAQWTR